jgi:DNA-directed RNA polymerase specialized sigma24 family protein
MLDDDEVDDLIALAIDGDDAAWHALWAYVEPMLERTLARPGFLGYRLGRSDDDRRNIIVDVMARVRANDNERLRRYLETKRQSPELRFGSWLRVVAKRVGIDYMRRHPDYIDRRHEGGGARGDWVEPGTLPSQSRLGGARPPVTARGTVRQMLEYAAGAIPAEQRHALDLWMRGESFASIATATGVGSAREAERLVRAAIERLRRRFRDHDVDGGVDLHAAA